MKGEKIYIYIIIYNNIKINIIVFNIITGKLSI